MEPAEIKATVHHVHAHRASLAVFLRRSLAPSAVRSSGSSGRDDLRSTFQARLDKKATTFQHKITSWVVAVVSPWLPVLSKVLFAQHVEVLRNIFPSPLLSSTVNYSGLQAQTWNTASTFLVVALFEDASRHPVVEWWCGSSSFVLRNMARQQTVS